MASKRAFDSYFDATIQLLKFISQWPNCSNFMRIHNVLMMILFLSIEYAVGYVSTTFLSSLRGIRIGTNCLMTAVKCGIIYKHQGELLKMMATLQDSRYSYDFDLTKIVERYKRTANRLLVVFSSLAYLCLANSTLLKLVHYWMDRMHGEFHSYMDYLPVEIVTPFELDSFAKFSLHNIFANYLLFITATGVVATDCLFSCLLSCISAHVEILQTAFRTIRTRCVARLEQETPGTYSKVQLDDEMLAEMKKCIRHLQMILDVSGKLELMYNLQTLCQVMVSLVEMCLSLYFLITNISVTEIWPELIYFLALWSELMLYCWFGNMVTEQAGNLSMSIYECDWYDCTNAFKSCMIITMVRMRRPVEITIGKFTPLSLASFLTIAKAAYSVCTFLQTRTTA